MSDRRRQYSFLLALSLAAVSSFGALGAEQNPASAASTASCGAGGGSADAALLRELKETLWPRAYREGDPVLLDQILAREFQMIGADGSGSTKAEELDYVAKHRTSHLCFRFEIQRLDIFENCTAVVSGRGVAIRPATDPDGSYQYRSSNVLIKRDGRWQAIASHVSGVGPLADPAAEAQACAAASSAKSR